MNKEEFSWTPPWEFAPYWAAYAGFDQYGQAFWFEETPKFKDNELQFNHEGGVCRLGTVPPKMRSNYRGSIISRV